MVDLTPARFEELVGDALDAVPAPLLRLLDNVIIRVEDRCAEDVDLLGLYEGIALTERDSTYTWALPDTITLYRLPLCELAADEDELAHEVAVTVVHELGHHFGIDEQRLHDLGWG